MTPPLVANRPLFCFTRVDNISHAGLAIIAGVQRFSWREVFSFLSNILVHGRHAMLLQCSNGNDRSCLLDCASLRLQHGPSHTSALALVSQRIDVRGHSLFSYATYNDELLYFLDVSRGEFVSAETGIMRWHGTES